MSRIKMLGLVLVLVAVAAVGLSTRPVAADPIQCNGCWSAGWGTTCYPHGAYHCFGGGGGCIGSPPGPPGCGGGAMGYQYVCGPTDWIPTGYHC
jgi:hypothetical protein